MIVYPVAGYNSFISLDDALEYFKNRLHSDEFLTEPWTVQEPALITAYRSIIELDLTIDPTEADQIQALKNAQCEQALHELKEDLDSQNVRYFALQGIMTTKTELPRYSQRTMAILRPYISSPVCQVVR